MLSSAAGFAKNRPAAAHAASGAGLVNPTLAFSGIETVTESNAAAPGSGMDTFALADGGSVTGAIVGGTGTNTLSFAGYTTAITVNLQSKTATHVGAWSGIT